MNYPRLLTNLRQHPGNRDHRQRRLARLVFKVCRKMRGLGMNPSRPPLVIHLDS